MKFQKWIVLPDLQLPYEDLKTVAAVEAFMRDEQASDHPFDGWLQLGDFLDLPELSRWVVGEEDSIDDDVQESFEAGHRFLTRHRKILGPKARMVLLQGNHDYRTVDFLTKNGNRRWRKTLSYERRLHLDELGVQYVKVWEEKNKPFRLGNAYFVHGQYTNQYHAKKMVQNYGCCIFYGHTHDVMEIPITQLGPDKTLVGKSLGCLCQYNQKYMKGAPSNWAQAFSIFYFFEDGYFQEETIKIFKHRFVGPTNQKVYDGVKLTK